MILKYQIKLYLINYVTNCVPNIYCGSLTIFWLNWTILFANSLLGICWNIIDNLKKVNSPQTNDRSTWGKVHFSGRHIKLLTVTVWSRIWQGGLAVVFSLLILAPTYIPWHTNKTKFKCFTCFFILFVIPHIN